MASSKDPEIQALFRRVQTAFETAYTNIESTVKEIIEKYNEEAKQWMKDKRKLEEDLKNVKPMEKDLMLTKQKKRWFLRKKNNTDGNARVVAVVEVLLQVEEVNMMILVNMPHVLNQQSKKKEKQTATQVHMIILVNMTHQMTSE